jgi:MFS family permease
MTLAMIAGPLVGGYITDSLSWRWIFYINMPIGGAALIYLALTLHVPVHKVKHKIDYLGAALLAVAASSLVLLTTWGGTQYPWRSVQIVGLGVAAIAATSRSSGAPPSPCCRCMCSATGTSRSSRR